jgi:hypothetical protein
MCYQQPVLDTIPEKEIPRTRLKETLKFQNSEDGHSTDEGSPGPSSSCTSDEENCHHSSQEADIDSISSGLNSSCASDDEDISSLSQGTVVPAAKVPSASFVGQCSRLPPGLAPPGLQPPQLHQVPDVTPQSTRNKAPLAEQLTSKLLAVSEGRPVKVWLSPDYAPLKRLDATIPAKKKPVFAEYALNKKKTLDPSMPCKKHLPSWLVNLDSGLEAPKPKPQTFVRAPPAPVLTAESAPR